VPDITQLILDEHTWHPLGTDAWWAAVGSAREANDEHMGEEEREGLADFRLNAPSGLRDALGVQFAEFLEAHPTTEGLDVSDKDPQEYVRESESAVEPTGARPAADGSLGIGSLKGR
jgi:hypothetical protein